MSGGEEHAAYIRRIHPPSLDHFTRCPTPGCDWQILYGAQHCYQHRGPASAQYQTDHDGAIIRTRFMVREADPDFDPAA